MRLQERSNLSAASTDAGGTVWVGFGLSRGLHASGGLRGGVGLYRRQSGQGQQRDSPGGASFEFR
jgi:hypothetical protein